MYVAEFFTTQLTSPTDAVQLYSYIFEDTGKGSFVRTGSMQNCGTKAKTDRQDVVDS